jgi:hypothetical protein
METSEKDLRAVATKRVRAKRDFFAHLASYLIINGALVAVWALTGEGYPWFVWPLLGWGVGVAFHGVGLLVNLSSTSRAVDGKDVVIAPPVATGDVRAAPMLQIEEGRKEPSHAQQRLFRSAHLG